MSCKLRAHEYTWHKRFEHNRMRLPKCSSKDILLLLVFFLTLLRPGANVQWERREHYEHRRKRGNSRDDQLKWSAIGTSLESRTGIGTLLKSVWRIRRKLYPC